MKHVLKVLLKEKKYKIVLTFTLTFWDIKFKWTIQTLYKEKGVCGMDLLYLGSITVLSYTSTSRHEKNASHQVERKVVREGIFL